MKCNVLSMMTLAYIFIVVARTHCTYKQVREMEGDICIALYFVLNIFRTYSSGGVWKDKWQVGNERTMDMRIQDRSGPMSESKCTHQSLIAYCGGQPTRQKM